MPAIDIKARNLLRSVEPTDDNAKLSHATKLSKLAAAGFSIEEVFHELRTLYDGTEDDSIKRQVLDLVVKVQGLMATEKEAKETPQITFTFVNTSASRLDNMLCPTAAVS